MFALVPQLDARMANESYAYRPGRSVEKALAHARKMIGEGLVWIVDADIKSFFDSVPHRTLLQELAIWIDDPRLLALIGQWLSAWGRGRRGLPQGASLSPLLANLYLHPLDRLIAAAGISAVRYADDFILLTRSRQAAERAHLIAAAALRSRGLRLNPDKTRIVHISEGVRFLGQVLGGAHTKSSAALTLLPPWGSAAANTPLSSRNAGFFKRLRHLLSGLLHEPCKVAKPTSRAKS
jgi:CRISPR-associated protein Cas1